MSTNLLTTDLRCDLNRLERTNMVTKMEDRVKVDLVAFSKLIPDNLQLCDSASLPHAPKNSTASRSNSIRAPSCNTSTARSREPKYSAADRSNYSQNSAPTRNTARSAWRTWSRPTSISLEFTDKKARSKRA